MGTHSYFGTDWVHLRPFQALEGVPVKMIGTEGMHAIQLAGFAPTKDCSNIEALLHWWNHASSSTEMKKIYSDGEEGYGWHYNEDGLIVSTCDPKVAGEDFDRNTYVIAYQNMGNDAWPIITYKDREMYYSATPAHPASDRGCAVRDIIEQGYINKIADDIVIGFVDSVKLEERSFIETDLVPYVNNFMAEAILNGLTDTEWDEYLEGLKDYQYYEWIDWYQGLYDGEF